MSPSSSTDASRKTTTKPHSRPVSTNTSRLPHLSQDCDTLPARLPREETNQADVEPKQAPHYTLLIRLPFSRSSFQDPAPVTWDSTKDQALWKLISSGPKTIDWAALSKEFNVELAFLLQQAAWLSERHFRRMREGVGRLGVGAAGSPVGEVVRPGSGEGKGSGGVGGVKMERAGSAGSGGAEMREEGSGGVGGEAMRREGSGGVAMERKGSRGSQKQSSQLSRKSTPLQTADGTKVPPSPRSQHPGISRTPSTATVTQSRAFAASSRRPSPTYSRGTLHSIRQTINRSDASLGNDGTSESESEDDTSHRQLPRRSSLSKKPAMGTLSSDGDAEDDDDDDSGGFLPFATKPDDEDDPTATIMSPPRPQPSTTARQPSAKADPTHQPESSSASSTTSSQPTPNPARTGLTSPNALSPQQRAQLSRLSPRYRNAVSGSEGSPSMGSSFSDLEDLSVTQSALEDALLSQVRGGGSIGFGVGLGRGRGVGGGG